MTVVFSVTWHFFDNDVTTHVFGNGACLLWEFSKCFWFNLFRITIKLKVCLLRWHRLFSFKDRKVTPSINYFFPFGNNFHNIMKLCFKHNCIIWWRKSFYYCRSSGTECFHDHLDNGATITPKRKFFISLIFTYKWRCLQFYSSGNEMASTLNVTIKLKQNGRNISFTEHEQWCSS